MKYAFQMCFQTQHEVLDTKQAIDPQNTNLSWLLCIKIFKIISFRSIPIKMRIRIEALLIEIYFYPLLMLSSIKFPSFPCYFERMLFIHVGMLISLNQAKLDNNKHGCLMPKQETLIVVLKWYTLFPSSPLLLRLQFTSRNFWSPRMIHFTPKDGGIAVWSRIKWTSCFFLSPGLKQCSPIKDLHFFSFNSQG